MSWDQYYLKMCHCIAEKSKDPSTKVGCVIVGLDNEVRSQGFNGFPRHVGDELNIVISFCWEKYRTKFCRPSDEQLAETLLKPDMVRGPNPRYERPAKYFFTEHAERNAIYNAARCGIPLKDCRIYIPWFPCHDCARGIIQSGINHVILDKSFDDSELKERWKESWDYARIMLDEAEIIVRKA